MGACRSDLHEIDALGSISNNESTRDEKKRNKQVEKMMRADFYRQKAIIRVLLLGAGQSGKTTILKQMKLLHPMKNRYCSIFMKRMHTGSNAVSCQQPRSKFLHVLA